MFPPLAAAFVLAVIPAPAPSQAAPSPAPAADTAEGAHEKTPLASAAKWLTRVNTGAPGNFPPPRSFVADYRVTWEDLEAAHVEAKCTSPDANGEIATSIKTATSGAARLLWKMDAYGLSIADRRTLRPVRFEQTQDLPKKHSYVRVDFTPQGAVRVAHDVPKDGSAPPAGVEAGKARPRHYEYPGMLDMHSALLYLRSLPLAAGEEKTMLVMSSGAPYLVTIKVLGRGRVSVKAGDYPAIECMLALERVNKHGDLEPHRGFKSAHAWISDDANRVLLKVQAEIFVGTVDLELEKLSF